MEKKQLTLAEMLIVLASLAVVIVLAVLASYTFVNTVCWCDHAAHTENNLMLATLRVGHFI